MSRSPGIGRARGEGDDVRKLLALSARRLRARSRSGSYRPARSRTEHPTGRGIRTSAWSRATTTTASTSGGARRRLMSPTVLLTAGHCTEPPAQSARGLVRPGPDRRRLLSVDSDRGPAAVHRLHGWPCERRRDRHAAPASGLRPERVLPARPRRRRARRVGDGQWCFGALPLRGRAQRAAEARVPDGCRLRPAAELPAVGGVEERGRADPHGRSSAAHAASTTTSWATSRS